MMLTLQTNLELERVADGTYQRECDKTFWGHGALFGGYPEALALAAMRTELDDPAKAPMAMTVHFLRPFVEGLLCIEVSVERTGRTMTNMTARMTSAGKLAGLVVANFAVPRPGAEFLDAQMPDVAPVGDDAPIDPSAGVPTHAWFDLFPRIGSFTLAGQGRAEVGGWVRPIEPWPIDESLLLLLADLWLPAAYHRWSEPTVAVSADITTHFRAPLPLEGSDPGSPLLVVLRTKASALGFVDEDVEIWSDDGRLVGQSRQVRYITGEPGTAPPGALKS